MFVPKPLSGRKQLDLVRRAQKGDRRARETLIQTNERLLLKKARRVNSWGYAEHDDVVQAGRIGINIAIDKFREDKGASFITYASWWVRAEMQSAVAGVLTLGGFNAENALFSTNGRRPTREAAALAKHQGGGMFRLDEPAGEDDMTFADLLMSETPLAEEQLVVTSTDAARSRAVTKIFSMMKPRHVEVSRRRFMGDEPETLEAIGHDFGVSRERVRQIEVQVYDRLKHLATKHRTVVRMLREI